MNDLETAVNRYDGMVRAISALGLPTDEAGHDALLLALREMFEELIEATTLATRSLDMRDRSAALVADIERKSADMLRSLKGRS